MSSKAKAAVKIDYEGGIELLRKMRANRDAPVDTEGAECLGKGDAKQYRFQVLVSLLLSSMTKDPDTAAAVRRLQDFGLTTKFIADSQVDDLKKVIYGVGFHNKKAVYLKQCAQILEKDYGGDIPPTLGELLKLPGIGSKMAKIIMSCAWGKVVGIAADTHVHRIANRIGWVKSKNPLETEVQLEECIPKEHWKDLNVLMVGFGQQICSAKSPKCSSCLLYQQGMCQRNGLSSVRVKKE